MVTHKRIKKLLNYDPENGLLTWKTSRGRAKAGDQAGSLDGDGYRQITIDGWVYRAARIIWLWNTGEWPLFQIDHKNRVRDDNRWNNLRDATGKINSNNRNSRSGKSFKKIDLPTGVYVHGDRFRARAWKDDRQHHLGCFDTIDEAQSVYLNFIGG